MKDLTKLTIFVCPILIILMVLSFPLLILSYATGIVFIAQIFWILTIYSTVAGPNMILVVSLFGIIYNSYKIFKKTHSKLNYTSLIVNSIFLIFSLIIIIFSMKFLF